MVSLVGFDPWLAQPAAPQWPFRLNRDSDFARDLVGLWVPDHQDRVLRDYGLRGIHGTQSAGSLTIAGNELGGISHSGFAGSAIYAVPGQTDLIGSPLTIAVWASSTTYKPDKAAFAIRDGTNITDLCVIYPFDTFLGDGFRLYLDGSQDANENVGAVAADGRLHCYVCTLRSNTDRELYVDGRSVAVASTSKSIDAHTDITIGAWRPSQQGFHGSLFVCALWKRGFSGVDAYRLWDPTTRWDLLESPRTFVAVPTAAPAPAGGVPSGLGLLGVGV